MHQPEPEEPPMTDEMMSLRGLLEKSADADVLCGMIGFAAERLMEVGAPTGRPAARRAAGAIGSGMVRAGERGASPHPALRATFSRGREKGRHVRRRACRNAREQDAPGRVTVLQRTSSGRIRRPESGTNREQERFARHREAEKAARGGVASSYGLLVPIGMLTNIPITT